MRPSPSLLLLCALLLGEAEAQTKAKEAEARVLFNEAEVHFNLGEFAKALDLYTRAYKISPLPGFLFNIGQCQRHLGKLEQALFSYRIYLQRLPNAPNRVHVRELILVTEKQLAERRASQPVTRPVEKTSPRPDRPASAPTPTPPVESVEERPRGPRPVLLWTGVGLSAALLATAVATGQLASDRSKRYQDRSTPLADLADLKDSGERLRTASIVTFSLAGATAIGTGLYWLLSRRARPPRAAFSVAPTSGGAMLAFSEEL